METNLEVNNEEVRGIRIDFDDLGTDPFSAVSVRSTPSFQEEEEEPVIVEQEGVEEAPEDGTDDGIITDGGGEGSDEETVSTDDDLPGFYSFLGEELKKDGFIDSELSFDPNVDGMTVYSAYKEKLKKDTEPLIRQEVIQALENEGFDQEDLLVARALRQGVDPRLLSQHSMYELYSRLGEDTPTEDQISVISQMYKERGLNDAETKNLIAVAEQNDTLEDLFTNSKQYFGGKWQEFKKAEEVRSEQRNQAVVADMRKAEELLNKVVTSHEVHGEKLTPAQAKALNDAVRQQNEVVEVDGVKQKASELQKFILDFYNNPEFRLLAFKIFKFRSTDKEELQTEAKKQVEDEFLGGYKQRLIKSQAVSKSKEVREHLQQRSKSSQPIFIDLAK